MENHTLLIIARNNEHEILQKTVVGFEYSVLLVSAQTVFFFFCTFKNINSSRVRTTILCGIRIYLLSR